MCHLVAECEQLQHVREESLKRLEELFKEENLPPPSTVQEKTDAVLQGGLFRVSGTEGSEVCELIGETLGTNVIFLSENYSIAQVLCSQLCCSLDKARDDILNSI